MTAWCVLDAAPIAMKGLRIASWADRNTATLSGGEAQKVMLARAVAQEPEVLLLDEPTANLDLGSRTETLSFVKRYAQRRHVAVLMVSHDINTALQTCARLLLLSPQGVLKVQESNQVTQDDLSQTFGINVRLHAVGDQRIALVNS